MTFDEGCLAALVGDDPDSDFQPTFPSEKVLAALDIRTPMDDVALDVSNFRTISVELASLPGAGDNAI
jgi:hypothetical protein